MATHSRNIVGWILRLMVAAILAIGAIPKFTGGSEALAEKLPGGSLAVTGIGVAEVLAVLLILMPKTSQVGAALAAFLAAAGFLALERTAGGS